MSTMKPDDVSGVKPASATVTTIKDVSTMRAYVNEHWPVGEKTGNVLLPRNKDLANDPSYNAFMTAMDLAYGLKDLPPGQLKFVGIDGLERISLSDSFVIPPKVMVNPGFDHPKLAIALAPKKPQGGNVTNDTYHAPVFVKDVDRWQFAKDRLGKYLLDRWSGAEAGQELFQQSRSLSEILAGFDDLQIIDSTPVVEAVAILPISADGSFTTEFAPQIRFDIGDHDHYKVSVVSQNSLSRFVQLIQGRSLYNVQTIEADKSMHNFSADFIPSMDEFSQMLVPCSAGHMILIASPIEKPKPKSYDLNFGLGSDYGGGFRGDGLTLGGGLMKGGSIGGVDIGIGSKTGQGSLYDGDLSSSRKGHTTIFHIRALGVMPYDITKLAANASQLGSTIDAYSTNN